MFSGSKSWFGSKSLWKPKNIHSLDYLKYLYGVLCKNAVVTEHNQQLLIEVWRIISEILIWGDQNDSKVFDFFLEKSMLTFYISYIRQPSARFIIVQLLQTLNILFENTAQETSIYFLLSNNHVNDIINSKFDFVDEEVMAYYISFLKTLSLKLNSATIHFFFNEHSRNFPLLTEALKFDSHPESMVRIAARTITLNVFRVRNRAVTRFVCDQVAPIQFSNFAFNVSRQAIAMDACLAQAQSLQHQQGSPGDDRRPPPRPISSFQRTRERLQDYSAEHLDLLHYAADVMQLEIEELNAVITPILMSRLLLPIYLPSLLQGGVEHLVDNTPRISQLLSLYLLSLFFVVFKGTSLVSKLLSVIVNADMTTNSNILRHLGKLAARVPPSLIDALDSNSLGASTVQATQDEQVDAVQQQPIPREESSLELSNAADDALVNIGQQHSVEVEEADAPNQTDDEKLAGLTQTFGGKVYLSTIMRPFDSVESSDRETVFTLTFLLALTSNAAIPKELLAQIGLNSKSAPVKSEYNSFLIDKLISILTLASKNDSKIRPVTVALCAELLKSQVIIFPSTATSDSVFSSAPSSPAPVTCLSDHDLARLESAREESTLVLRNFFKSEDAFVDTFEDEYQQFHDRRRVNVERILDDTHLLLSPAVSTPLSGVLFAHRLPCGEVERSRSAMRVFFTLRSLSLLLQGEAETELPLFKIENLISLGEALDLNNSDLLACSVTVTNEKTERLFLVLERDQLILVRPDALRMGWGVVRVCGPLHDVELSVDKDDGRGLHVTLHPLMVTRWKGTSNSDSSSLGSLAYCRALVTARFQFDDHIRCRAARERIIRGRQRVRTVKLQKIANLLEIPPEATSFGSQTPSQVSNSSMSTPTVDPSVLSMFNPKIQQAIMAATPILVKSSSSAAFVPIGNQTERVPASSSQQDHLTSSARKQTLANSETPVDSPAIAPISTDEHRRRYVKGIVADSETSSAAAPPIPPRAFETGETSAKLSESSILIDLENPKIIVKSESDAVALFKAAEAEIDEKSTNSDDSLILKKAIEELAVGSGSLSPEVETADGESSLIDFGVADEPEPEPDHETGNNQKMNDVLEHSE